MIHHVVCFRFKAGTPAEAIAAAGAALLALQGRIPEIRAIRWGPNHAPTASDYSHVLTVVVDNMAAVGRYLEHPLHQETVARYLAPIREARLAIDVEV
jgi:Stress responsive A/B Barrel Domain